MDFAKKQLEKYGWTEGKGLGKEENGICQPLQPKQKRSQCGLGHNMADEFTNNWWENAYNNASNNIKVNTKINGEIDKFTVNKNEYIKEGSHKNIKDDQIPLYFQTFVHKAVLTNGNTIHKEDEDIYECEMNSSKTDSKIKLLTDDELFEACGKRTIHKGARHGLKSNGKLNRLQEQEKLFLSQQKINKDIKDGFSILKKNNETQQSRKIKDASKTIKKCKKRTKE